jgi:hypothetical protein
MNPFPKKRNARQNRCVEARSECDWMRCLQFTPTIDHLFDRGFISFKNSGELLITPAAHEESMIKMGIITDRVVNVVGFAEPQREFLEFHRTNVFLKREISA